MTNTNEGVNTKRMRRTYSCFGCGAEERALDRMMVVPGKGDRDGRHHCKQCYAEWLAGVLRT